MTEEQMPVFATVMLAPGDPGALLDVPYSYEFGGLRFGSGTDYTTTEVDGLLSMPSTSSGDIDREDEHGAHPGLLLMQKRIISFDMTITGSAGIDIESKLAVARQVFQVPRKRHSRNLSAFAFWRPGEPKKMCFARCTKREFTSNFKTARGLAEGSVELTAPSSLIYSVESFTTIVPSATGTGTATINMTGDYVDGAWPKLTITGPVNTALIQNVDDDARTIRLDLNMTAGQTAVVDVEKEIVWIDGVRQSTAIRSDNQWWALLPGSNEIIYVRQGGTDTSTVTIEHRDVWQ